MFPPQTDLDDSFDYDIELSSRWLPEAVYIGYSGSELPSESQNYTPFDNFSIECKNSRKEQLQNHADNWHFETVVVRDNSCELQIAYMLDGGPHNIRLFASFSYQSYCYSFHGDFPLAKSEFSIDDPNVLKAHEIVVEYVNGMMS